MKNLEDFIWDNIYINKTIYRSVNYIIHENYN
uniref:Uncharacterized protein n=1 Tax=viral metagenome TaxID=1070528 RepID=A0A6C0E3H8_9ZZZZ